LQSLRSQMADGYVLSAVGSWAIHQISLDLVRLVGGRLQILSAVRLVAWSLP